MELDLAYTSTISSDLHHVYKFMRIEVGINKDLNLIDKHHTTIWESQKSSVSRLMIPDRIIPLPTDFPILDMTKTTQVGLDCKD